MMSDLMKAVEAAMADDRPIPEILREAETKRGFQIAKTRGGFWLPEADWHEDTVASLVRLDGRRALRLVLAVARNPGTGAFSRLATQCLMRGWMLIVVDPNEEFATILQRRGFIEMRLGRTFEERETWAVPAGHKRAVRHLARALGLTMAEGTP